MPLARSAAMMRVLILVTLLLGLLPTGRGALAHAVLIETSPANGAILKTAPREVVLRFNEGVEPISLTLVGRDGPVAIPPESVTARDTALHATLPGELSPGSYIVSYRVVSADSHPVSGALLFAVGTPSRAAPVAPDLGDQEDRWAFLVILNRILLLAGLLFSAGGVLFAAGVLGGDPTLLAPLVRPLRVGAAITAASAVLAVVLQGGLLTAAQMDAASLEHETLVGWHSTLGTSAALIACGMMLVILCFGRRPRRPMLWLATAGAILAAGALAASGHAATAPPRWLATPAMAAHGLAIAFWVGSLWPLLRVLRLRGVGAVDVVRRFSRAAALAVAMLLVTGLILAGLQLGGDLAALVGTPYGQLLLLKLGVVALLLALASYNKLRLTPALTRGEDTAAERLARSIRLEIAAVGLTLAVTALLGQAPPPRALATADRNAPAHGGHGAASGRTAILQTKGYTAVVAVTPGRVGRNTITIALQAPDGTPFAPLETSVAISLPGERIEPLTHILSAIAPGRYRWTTDGFLRPGTWQLSLSVLINDFERVTFDTTVAIGD